MIDVLTRLPIINCTGNRTRISVKTTEAGYKYAMLRIAMAWTWGAYGLAPRRYTTT